MMDIQNKILEFRKKQYSSVPSKAPMRLNKQEAIELAEYCISSKKNCSLLTFNVDPATAIELAKGKGFYGMLHDLVKQSQVFGIDLHPDWQEYDKTPVYY